VSAPVQLKVAHLGFRKEEARLCDREEAPEPSLHLGMLTQQMGSIPKDAELCARCLSVYWDAVEDTAEGH
jgi:hypothetical protein